MSSSALTESMRETLAVFSADEPLSTPEVAEAIGIGRRTAYDRLDRLAETDRLRTKKVGARARVWWQPDGSTKDSVSGSLLNDVLDTIDVGVWVLDDELNIAWVNSTAERYFGVDRGEIIGCDNRDILTDHVASMLEDGSTVADRMLATYNDNTDEACFECHITGTDAVEERWLAHRSKPITSGEFAGGRVELYYDISDQQGTQDRERTKQEEFVSLVEAVDEYAIFTLDADGYIQTWNPGAARIKGYEASDIIGEHFSLMYTKEDIEAEVPEENLQIAKREDSVTDEGWRVRADGSLFWGNVVITAIRDESGALQGFAKVTRDMTARREREEALRRQRDFTRRILETAPVGVLVVEEDGSYETVNERANQLLELEGDAEQPHIVGDGTLYDEDGEFVPPAERPYLRAFQTGERVRNWQTRVELSDGAARWLSTNVEPMREDNGEVERVLVTIEDISQLKAQANHLEKQRNDLRRELKDVFTRVDDAFIALDDEWRISFVNDRATELVKLSSGELIGARVWDVLYEVAEGDPRQQAVAAMESQEPMEFEFYSNVLDIWVEVRGFPSETGMSVYFRDVTEQKEREKELERYETIVTTIGDGVYVLDEDYCFQDVNEAYVAMTGYTSEALIGSPCTKVIDEEVANESAEKLEAMIANGAGESATLEADIIRADGTRLRAESKFTPLTSTDDDHVEKVGVVRDVSERVEREQELERQREQLAVVNSLNTVIRELTDAVIDQSTRDKIEETVCEHLASSGSYAAAMIIEMEPSREAMTLRAGAGNGVDPEDIVESINNSGYQDQVAIPTQSDAITVIQEIDASTTTETWKATAQAQGFTSFLSIPIEYEDNRYSVLHLYSKRPAAFEEDEQSLIRYLADVIGHAIAAAERKQALMSDELVELEFFVEEVFSDFEQDTNINGTMTLDYAIPSQKGDYRLYGTIDADDVGSLKALVPVIPSWESVTVRSTDDPIRFELSVSEPPVISAIAEMGGYVDNAIISDGDLRLTIHLAPGVDVRQILDTINETFPDAEMIRRQQITRPDHNVRRIRRRLVADLTDRQRAALDVSYHGGYFEWPRSATGEEVAEILGIAPATFSQHLRKAEQKVFTQLFERSAEQPAG